MNNLIILGVIGPWQIAIILAVVLLMFGGKKIPELMKGLGQGINEFKKSSKGIVDSEEIKNTNKDQKT